MPKKILLADDSVTIQKVVELTFVEEDYEVFCVSNGRAAVDKIKEDRPDILLCDVIMPEMNGYEVASFVKGDPAYSSIPVILLTGTFEPFDEDKARSTGADTYITKPFDSKMLVDKVEELLSKRVVYAAPEHTETAEVFQSRQEFVVSSDDEPAEPGAEAATEESGAFMSPELEYEMPGEAPEPAPQSSVEQTVISADRPAEPQDLEVSSSLPSPPEESGFDEQDAGELILESADVEDVGVPGSGLEDETTADMGTRETTADELSEPIDVGEIMPEDEIPESAFTEVVTPAGVGDEHEAGAESTAPEDLEPTLETVGQTESETPAAEEAEEVGGFEPTSFGEPFEEQPETGEPPPIVHELTEQQEMVSEAQKVLDAQAEAEMATEEEPVQEQETGEEEGGAVMSGATFGGLEQELPQDQPEPKADEEKPAEVDAAATILDESPFVSDDEEGKHLEVESEAVQADEEVGLETVAGEQDTSLLEAGEVPADDEVSSDREADFAFADMRPVEEQPSSEEGAGPAEMEPVESAAQDEAAPDETPAAPVQESQRVSAAQVDSAEVERVVREAVERLLPEAVERAVAEAVDAAVRKAVEENVSASVREAASNILPDMVREQAADVVPGVGREALGAMLPDMIRQSAGQNVSDVVKPLVEAETASAVTRAIAESLPEAIRQAAVETTPGVVGQVTEEKAPDVIRETVKAISRDIVADEVKALLPDVVRPLAWEVIPELAESIIKRRIQELETEETD